MLKVGIIDSGLPASHHYHVLAARDFPLTANVHGTNKLDRTLDQLGHGSAVTKIINSRRNAHIVCARVFHDKLTCTPSQIAEALRWMISLDVNIINMSFGLRTDRSVLKEACQQALNKNILLVAAAPSQGEAVYPSNYNGVIKATGDARCQPNEIAWLNDQQADFAGFSGIPYQGPAGASIGCASVTAAIVQIKTQYPHYDQQQVIQALIAQASYQDTQQESKLKQASMRAKQQRHCHKSP